MNIQLTIGLILSVTGLSIPADVFHGPVCTNLSADPIKRAATCDVYQATLGDEKVAKKVFYLNHSAEKTVEAYARVRNVIYSFIQHLNLLDRKSRGTLNYGQAFSPTIYSNSTVSEWSQLRGLPVTSSCEVPFS